MIIHVTQEDIVTGCKCEAMNCPVARAIERAIGHEVAVAPIHKDDEGYPSWQVTLYHLPSWQRITLPNEVKVFARAFDMKQAVEPFTFELDYDECE